jgi:hypothetical protein
VKVGLELNDTRQTNVFRQIMAGVFVKHRQATNVEVQHDPHSRVRRLAELSSPVLVQTAAGAKYSEMCIKAPP